MTEDTEGLDLGQFFENSLDLMTVASIDGYFKVLNPAWTELLGWDRVELMAQPFLDFVHRDDVEPTLDELSTLAEGASTVSFENRYRRVDGTYVWLQWNARPRGPWIYAVARDITAGKRVEESLRRSERFLDSIVEHIPNMVFVKDAQELRFVRINRAGEDLLGFSREELAGKSDYDFFPRDEAGFFVTTDREVLAIGDVVDIPAETIDTRHRGQRILHTKKIPILDDDGRPAFLLGIAEDITELIEGQNLLRLRQETLAAVFDASPDAIMTLDRDMVIDDVSEAIEGIQPVSVSDLRGRSALDIAHPDDRSALEESIRGLLDNGSTQMTIRCRLGSGDHDWTHIEARGRALHDATGETTGAVVVFRDITESLAAAAAMQKTQLGEAEHRLVEDLQRRALVPPPDTVGLEFAGHYQSARSGLGMGGDWYHGLALDNGSLGMIVGDVVGHGLTAGGDMTQLSGMLSTLLRVGTPLEDLFTTLHAAIGPLDIMATVVVCEVDPASRTVRHISAGHPPMIIVAPDGATDFVEGGRRPPVGVPCGRVDVAEVSLSPGSTLIAYTDGLVERRNEDFDVGMARLADAARDTRSLDVEAQLDEVVRRCTDGHRSEDDIAVVAVRMSPI